MYEKISNGADIKTNIYVDIGGRNSENNYDATTAKNDDDEGNINKFPIPKAN